MPSPVASLGVDCDSLSILELLERILQHMGLFLNHALSQLKCAQEPDTTLLFPDGCHW